MKELINPNFDKRGYLQVFYGDGKGKTTASMGLALRALGQGWKVLIMQFVKGGNREQYGEYNSFMSLKDDVRKRLKYKNCGLDKVIFKENITDEDRLEGQLGWNYVLHNHKEYDLIILDELNIAIDLDIIHLAQVKEFVLNKPDYLEVVITGRNAKPTIRKMAHLVSKVEAEKHYWDLGVAFRKGIEI